MTLLSIPRLCAIAAPLLLCAAIGCNDDQGHRTEVMPNAEGGVSVKRVPDDSPHYVRVYARPEDIATTHQTATLQQRIDQLEADNRAKDAEIERLKAAAPKP